PSVDPLRCASTRDPHLGGHMGDGTRLTSLDQSAASLEAERGVGVAHASISYERSIRSVIACWKSRRFLSLQPLVRSANTSSCQRCAWSSIDRPAEVSDASRRRPSVADAAMTRYPAAVALLINRDAPLWSIPTSCAIAFTVAGVARSLSAWTASHTSTSRPCSPPVSAVTDRRDQCLTKWNRTCPGPRSVTRLPPSRGRCRPTRERP